MRLKISYKLALVLAASNLAVLALVMLLIERNLTSGFLDYIKGIDQRRAQALAGQLELGYAENQSWLFLRERPERIREILGMDLSRPPPRGGPRPPPRNGAPPPRRIDGGGGPIDNGPGNRPERGGERQRGPERRKAPESFDPSAPPIELERRIFIRSADGVALLGDPKIGKSADQYPLRFGDQSIGTLFVFPPPQISEQADLDFVTNQQRALWIIAASALAIALIAAGLLGGWLVRPLKAVARAARDLAAGQYETRLALNRGDELGELATDFDRLAQALERNRDDRRRLLADISHELRTPLSILRGELDAVSDGVRPLGQSTLSSLDSEVSRLVALVDDLYELAQSDAGGLSYRMGDVDLGQLVRAVFEDFSNSCERAQLALEYMGPEMGIALVRGDSQRLEQLLRNLMRNSLAYTDSPGRVRVTLQRVTQQQDPKESPGANEKVPSQKMGWQLLWEDSAPGVSESAMERIFDRLYRVDESRNRSSGGAGIGLSIVRNIVQAHGGGVTAGVSTLGGLTISLIFPQVGER